MSALPAEISQPTVLIVDDTPANLGVMVGYLESEGLRVLIARDGEEGIQRATLTQPDIILLDVVMPRLDGFETCRRLRAMEHLRDTPIIFMTALSESTDKIRGFEAGGVDYVTKPLEVHEVRARVRAHLRLHLAQRQLVQQNAQLQSEIVRRTRATAALEEQRAFLQQVIDTTPQFIYAADRDGRLSLVNRALAEFTGTTVMRLLGRPAATAFGDSPAAQRTCRADREVLETLRESMMPEENCDDHGGRPHVLHTIKRPLFDSDGRATQVLSVSTDITERKHIEAELEQHRRGLEAEVAQRTAELRERNLQLKAEVADRKRAEEEVRRLNADLESRVAQRTEQLRSAVDDLEGFSYSVSHDLRAPLRAIDNFTKIILEEHLAQLDAEGMRLFGIVRKNATMMGTLIDDILAFARAGRREFALTTVDLNNLAEEVWRELAPAVAGRDVRLSIHGLPLVQADVSALRQVFTNLIDNALKFTRTRKTSQIDVGGYTQDGMVVCFVRDNGVGFDPRYSHKLFGVFQRLHHTDEFEGTGIGLGIVKRIIDKHGGRVWVEGELDKGATFFFSIPSPSSHT